jgi:hypothetical protein
VPHMHEASQIVGNMLAEEKGGKVINIIEA